MLRIDLKVGQSIKIGDAVITIEEKSGKTAKLAIDAPKSIKVERVQHHALSSIIAATGIGGKP